MFFQEIPEPPSRLYEREVRWCREFFVRWVTNKILDCWPHCDPEWVLPYFKQIQ